MSCFLTELNKKNIKNTKIFYSFAPKYVKYDKPPFIGFKKSQNMMNKLLKLLFITSLAINTFISCAPHLEVTNVMDTEEINPESKLYALPQTVILVEVKLKREINYPGPYKQFAGKFLGTEEVIKNKSVNWEIKSLDISSRQILDKKHYYILNESKKAKFSFENLEKKGLLYPINGFTNPEEALNEKPDVSEEYLKELFPDFFMKDNLVEREKTIYETVSNDSTSYTVLKKKKLYSSKTLEEKAEDAANLLVRLRKRRFKLLASIEKNSIGDQVRQYAKQYPEGDALKQMLQELSELENEILASFKGKTVTEEFTYRYEYIPERASGKYNLFNFDKKKGILPPEQEAGKEFTIRYILEHNTAGLIRLLSQKDETTYNAPVIRVPDEAKFVIEENDVVVVSKKVKVFQFGSLINVTIMP